MSGRVVIVDYGTGNLSSVARAMQRLNADFAVSSRAEDILESSRIILAGVGHFGRAMDGLRSRQLIEPLTQAVRGDGTPILGICLGMQLMTNSSEEGGGPGLGWIDAETVRLNVSDAGRHKVPNIGWSSVEMQEGSRLMKNVESSAEFYFLHSYILRLRDSDVLFGESTHETAFPAAIEKANVYGVQFHPEKSHKDGLQLLRNFLDL